MAYTIHNATATNNYNSQTAPARSSFGSKRTSIDESNRTHRDSIEAVLGSNNNSSERSNSGLPQPPRIEDSETRSRHRRGSSAASNPAAHRSTALYGASGTSVVNPTPNSRSSLSPPVASRPYSTVHSSVGSLVPEVTAYGDTTGTKGFGTGNDYERSDRAMYATVPGYYGNSTGTKGFGTGNTYEVKRVTPNGTGSTKGTPAGSAPNSLPTSRRGSNAGADDRASVKSRKPKFGDRLKATLESVTDKLAVVAK
ncbi:hypothetical protein BT96DRAFT_936595 [Gymnopus androsaceus JB14]|uniref:Uncharacterized protein n=1 Tax=Gymnopus androsaceus JB14 TaxID=1447944 RepID=A0A6A4HZM9_9AGAR|nr:hypothetical protein BT96DRAFT_936595 [Gymnopus androsaceus JB14]